MRRLMWFTIGFAIACGLCAWVLWSYDLWIFVLAAAALGGIAAIMGRDREVMQPALVAMGCAVGFLWFGIFQGNTLGPLGEMDGQILETRIRVSDYSYHTDYGTGLEGTISQGDKQYRIRAYLDEAKELSPGDTVSGPFRFRITTPGGEDSVTYHRGRGIFLILYQEGEVTHMTQGSRNWRERVSLFRRDLVNILENTFPADTMPFAKALLIGDTTDLSYEVDSDLKISGIRHVAAVSGLHVSILFALVSVATLKRRFLTALVGFPALLLFGALAGFTPSVTRSCLMCGLMLLGMLLDKNYDSATALAFAVLVMVAGNPLVITDVGFQLSVGSVAGIYLFADRLRQWMLSKNPEGRAWRLLVSSVPVSLSAMVFTIPLSAFYFQTASVIGIVTNLLTLWVISFIFYGILAVALLALIWQVGAVWLAWLVSWPIRYVLWIAGVLAEVPMGAVYARSVFVVVWLVFAYGLLALQLTGKRGRVRDLACCLVLTFCLSLLPARIGPWLDEVRFTVLDVGQGQCLMFQSRGKTVLVDCGGDRDAQAADLAAQALLSQGIRKLDALILTHWDQDHSGGLGELLTRVDTEILVLPPEVPEEALPAGQTIYAYETMSLTWEGSRIRIFPALYEGNSNEKSLCVLFDTENCDILITGDRNFAGEKSLLATGEIGRVDVLVAGHHGAKSSLSPELLERTAPYAVCISAGQDNRYGHPAPETLQRLEEFGCQVYRTDLQGDIIIRR